MSLPSGYYGRPRVAAPGEQVYESVAVEPTLGRLPPRIIQSRTPQELVNPNFGPLQFSVKQGQGPAFYSEPLPADALYATGRGGRRTKRRRHRTRRTAKKKTSTTKRRKLNRKTKKRK